MPSQNYNILQDDLFLAPVEPALAPAEQKRPPMNIRWRNVIWFAILHLAAIYGLYLLPFARVYTWIFTIFIYWVSATGITAGAHRLWTHRSYHAKLPLRIFLALCNSTAFQNDIIEWSRDHRVHHKYSETDADPHNAKRGFFFAHCGWLMVRKHPAVKEKGQKLDIADLLNDPVCRIQRKLYLPSVLLMCFIVPTVVPWYFWGESAWISYFVCAIFRYALSLNATWLVNSAAHLWGNKPYDKNINPSENILVTLGAMGEGFHNYHHTFPSDYSTSEWGLRCNMTTLFIDLMAWVGLAEHRKRISREAIERRKQRTGEGSRVLGDDSGVVKRVTSVQDQDCTASSAVAYVDALSKDIISAASEIIAASEAVCSSG